MAGRVFLLLVGGILASAALTLYLANRERHAYVEHVRIHHAAERMAQIVVMLEAVPLSAKETTLEVLNDPGMIARIIPPHAAIGGHVDPLLASRLHQRLGEARQIEAVQAPCLPQETMGASKSQLTCRMASIVLKDGSRLLLAMPPQPDRPATETVPHVFLFALMFVASLGGLAYGVARMSTRPLRVLADAAGELGTNIDRPALEESGPTEVRHAATAFNHMQAKIKAFVRDRTQVLAAITHDLQTPLTRLRLRLEKVHDDELRSKLSGDLSAMQDMVRDGLELARSLNTEEARQRLDFDSLVSSLCDDAAEAGQDVSLTGATGASILAAPGALRRCLTNLLDNAVKYGGRALVMMELNQGIIVVRIRDGGPGIPEALLDKVFMPFFRVEDSRSRETGGTGIGLTIARNIAEQHGGKLYLRNLKPHGLEAVLELPLA